MKTQMGERDKAVALAESLLRNGIVLSFEDLTALTVAEVEARNARRVELENELAATKTPMKDDQFDRLTIELVDSVMAATAKPPKLLKQSVKLLRVKARPLVAECARRKKMWEVWNELEAIRNRPVVRGSRCTIRGRCGPLAFVMYADTWEGMAVKLRPPAPTEDTPRDDSPETVATQSGCAMKTTITPEQVIRSPGCTLRHDSVGGNRGRSLKPRRSGEHDRKK